jgi:hypothetical protein
VHRISPNAARLPDQSDFGSLCKDGEKTSLSDYSFSTIRPDLSIKWLLKHKPVLQFAFDGLRKAGLPEE